MIWLLVFIAYTILLVIFLRKSSHLDKTPRPRRGFLYKNHFGKLILATTGILLIIIFLFCELRV